jgi:hypothetical protein
LLLRAAAARGEGNHKDRTSHDAAFAAIRVPRESF